MRTHPDSGIDALVAFFHSIRHRPGRSRALERLSDLESGLAAPTMPKGQDTHAQRLNRALNCFVAVRRLDGLDDPSIVAEVVAFLASAGFGLNSRKTSGAILYLDQALRLIGHEKGMLAFLSDISIDAIDELWLVFTGQVVEQTPPQWTDPAPIFVGM